MHCWPVQAIVCFLSLPATSGTAQGPLASEEPVIRLEADGPTSLVAALAFSPDSRTLYSAGWDKVIRVWSLNASTDEFRLEAAETLRVPIGPGQSGAINAMAISSDGKWLAVGGNAPVRREAGFRQMGFVLPRTAAMSDEMRMDQGRIFVFDTHTRSVRVLRGNLGAVVSLAFTPIQAGRTPWLVSAAYETVQGDESRVVRVWDLDQVLPQAGYVLPKEPAFRSRPGLAVWRLGTQPRQLSVAIAWGDGSLRVWDVERQTQYGLGDGAYNNSVTYLPTSGRLLTGGDVKLQFWGAATASQALSRQNALTLPGVPRAIVPFASQGSSKLNRAATLYRTPSPAEVDYIQIIDLDQMRPIGAGVELWPGRGTTPALAIDPIGRTLAIAGSPDHGVNVRSIQGLLDGGGGAQKLRSTGKTWQDVSFARHANKLGLLLSESRRRVAGGPIGKVKPNDTIFDFTDRLLLAASDDWKPSDAVSNEWTAEQFTGPTGRPTQSVISIRSHGQERSRITLEEGSIITDYALLAPRPSFAVPLVAIASYDPATGEPKLNIHNGSTGDQLRQCTGHSARIHGLSFSDDGRLLASVADDQTVSVWSLLDIDQVLGKRGAIPGLVLSQRTGAVAVVQVPAAAGASGQLRVTDTVKGIVQAAGIESIVSPLQFYEALARVKPGASVRVQVLSRDGAERQVELRVGQGVDERKPLLSLFITQGEPAARSAWVGWSPLGPYEASDRSVERLLGWHFNPRDINAPVSFAGIEQYRDEYYHEGLLKDLVERGQLQSASNNDPLPRPEMALWLQQADTAPLPIAESTPARVHDRHAAIRLAIYDAFPLEQLDMISWRLPEPVGDSPIEGKFQPVGDREWQADLSPLLVDRRTIQLHVQLRTKEAVPQLFEKTVSLRHQPLPPTIQLEVPQRVLRTPQLHLQAKLRPGAAAEAFVAHLIYKGNRIASFEQSEELQIQRDVKLETGENVFEILAQNRAALEGHEADESARQVISVAYFPPSQPEITIGSIAPVTASDDLTGERPGSGGVTTVAAPRIRLRGQIRAADESLTRAELLIGDQRRGLSRFEQGKHKEFQFDEEVTLEAGTNQLRLIAKTANSDVAQSETTVAYQPDVPRAVITTPPDGYAIYEQKEATALELEGKLLLPTEYHPFLIRLLINGNEPEPPAHIDIDEMTATFRAKLAVQPGENRIQITISNEWGSVWTSDVKPIRYLRPPSIRAFNPPALGRTPFVDLAARIMSPKDLPLLRVQVGNRVLPADSITAVSTESDVTEWAVTAKATPLEKGDNKIELLAWNRDGRCLRPGIVQLRFDPPPPPKAHVEIVDPSSDIVVQSPQYSMRFHVTSDSPLQRVEVLQGGRTIFAGDLLQSKPGDQGLFLFEETVPVQLERKSNSLRVVAVNDGGEQAATATVSYVPQPVRVVLDRLEPRNRPGTNISLEMDNGVLKEDASDAQIVLHGRVLWPDHWDTRLVETKWLHVRVNGLQQFPAELEPSRDEGVERRFRVELWLHRRTQNLIELELPGVAHEAGSRLALRMNCRNPQRPPRLHLLIVGVGEKDKQLLRSRALRAVQAQEAQGDHFSTPAFASGQIYTLAERWVTHGQIVAQIQLIRQNIIERKSASDVVIIYYQGRESIDSSGRFLFHASDRSIASDYLERLFANVPGAQILFLDVTRDRPDDMKRPEDINRIAWPAHIGVLRYAWQEQGASPVDARLIASLADATAKASRLVDVESYVSVRYRQLKETYADALKYEPYLPESLADLTIGAGSSGTAP